MLLFQNEERGLVTEIDISAALNQQTVGIIEETIPMHMSDLEKNRIYSLQLRVQAYSQNITTSRRYFSKFINLLIIWWACSNKKKVKE